MVKKTLKKVLWKHAIAPIRNAVALQQLQGLMEGTDYMPWTSSALEPAAVVTILNDIVINHRKTIVECGGGISTFLIAQLFKQHGESGAQIYTLENDAGWIDFLQSWFGDNGLDEYVTIVEAPLEPARFGAMEVEWYSEKAIDRVDGLDTIDLLFVDGPKAGTGPHPQSRYPALPVFFDRLANRCTVVLDDISRNGEQQIAAMWSEEYDLSFDERLLHGNIAIAIRGDHFNIT